MAIHGNTWQYMAIHAIHGYTWLHRAVHGNILLYMAIHGYTWQYIAMGLDKLRASEPASHASRASKSCESCKSSCEPCETDVSSQSIFPSSAFGYLARVFAILALLSISFCYLPSSFSSFVKVSFVLFCCR